VRIYIFMGALHSLFKNGWIGKRLAITHFLTPKYSTGNHYPVHREFPEECTLVFELFNFDERDSEFSYKILKIHRSNITHHPTT